MASEIFEDIERLVNSINPKIKESMREIRTLEFEIEMIKKVIKEKSDVFFSSITTLPRQDRIEGAFEIEKMHKKVLEISDKKMDVVYQAKQLLSKYITRVNEKMAQFHEKMDEDYPGTSQNIRLKVSNQRAVFKQKFFNIKDAKARYEKKQAYRKELLAKKHLNNRSDEFPSYNEIIPNFSTSTAGILANNHSSASAASQPPPLTALKQSRGKNIANKSFKTTIPHKSSNKCKPPSNPTFAKLAASSNMTDVNCKPSTTSKKSNLTQNKNQRKRKQNDNNAAVKPICTDINKKSHITDASLLDRKKEDKILNIPKVVFEETSLKCSLINTNVTENANSQNPSDPPTKPNQPNDQTKSQPSTENVAKDEKGVEMVMVTDSKDDTTSKVEQEVFCICKQPSYGEMIGCDSENCSIGWFHLECVGLTAAPDGEWFCSSCAVSHQKPSPSKSFIPTSDAEDDFSVNTIKSSVPAVSTTKDSVSNVTEDENPTSTQISKKDDEQNTVTT